MIGGRLGSPPIGSFGTRLWASRGCSRLARAFSIDLASRFWSAHPVRGNTAAPVAFFGASAAWPLGAFGALGAAFSVEIFGPLIFGIRGSRRKRDRRNLRQIRAAGALRLEHTGERRLTYPR